MKKKGAKKMQWKVMAFLEPYCSPKNARGAAAAAFMGLFGLGIATMPASALASGPQRAMQLQFERDSAITQVYVRRGGAVRRSTVVGPRGGIYHGRTAVRRGAVVRPGYRGGGVRWARPGWYGWPRGGAIAAGAALGMVTAATAAAWAGAPPAPGMCWYYTNPSRSQGFWDYCR